MESIVSLIVTVLGIASLILNIYISNSPKRREEERNAEIEKGREDIVNGNVDAVEQRIDRLCRAEDDRNAGIKDGKN